MTVQTATFSLDSRYGAYADALIALEAEDRRRHIPEETSTDLLDLCSNDYMGLSSGDIPSSDALTVADGEYLQAVPEDMRDEFRSLAEDAERMRGKGEFYSSSASRLLSGRQRFHDFLERWLGRAYGAEALLFNSGYHANMGAIGALSIPGTVFLVDRLMHASAYDALMACRADFERFPHNDTTRLRKLIMRRLSQGATRIVVVTESIFSMRGDSAPLQELVALRREFPQVLLYIDEAHAFGACGPRGLGLAARKGILPEVDILIGTFGKAAASTGAFAIARQPLHDWLLNAARSFIFSTALPPQTIWVSTVNCLRLYSAEKERARLKTLSRALGAENHIMALDAGSAGKALEMARMLRQRGIRALAIRRPTVPPGGEMVRLSLHASLSDEELRKVQEAVAETRRTLSENQDPH